MALTGCDLKSNSSALINEYILLNATISHMKIFIGEKKSTRMISVATTTQGRYSGGQSTLSHHTRVTIKKLWLVVPGMPWAQPDNPLYNEKEWPEYIPAEGYEGTCPPGATPENSPLDALPKDTPHPPQGLQILDFHPKGDSIGPAPQSIVDYVEQQGLWMSDNEIDEQIPLPHLNPTIEDGDFESSSGGFIDDTLEGDDFLTSSLGMNPDTTNEEGTSTLL